MSGTLRDELDRLERQIDLMPMSLTRWRLRRRLASMRRNLAERRDRQIRRHLGDGST